FAASPDAPAFAASIAWELPGSLALGAMVGAVFALYLRFVGREVTFVLLGMCALTTGRRAGLQLDPLLAAPAAGVVVENVATPAGDTLRDSIERGSTPILVLFFAAAGASLHVDALATIGLAALAISLVRLAAVFAGTRIGARLAGGHTPVTDLVW